MFFSVHLRVLIVSASRVPPRPSWRLGGSEAHRFGGLVGALGKGGKEKEGKGMERKEKEGKGRKRNEKEVRTRK